jgi:uncharacterized DUF497 family protein
VDIEWDARKAAANVRKHRIDFADAATILEDDLAVTVIDRHINEDRFVTVGMDGLGRTLVVVYACRGERIRLISARHPTSRERRQYEAGR